MKKTIIITAAVLLMIVIAFVVAYFVTTAPKYEGEFTVDREYVQNERFQSDENYGSITDYESAAKAGKAAIADRFGSSDGGLFEWIGCGVQYDAENDAYYVHTYHVNPNTEGGTYHVILQSDGSVLAIWGEK